MGGCEGCRETTCACVVWPTSKYSNGALCYSCAVVKARLHNRPAWPVLLLWPQGAHATLSHHHM
jgi:hypothetical protein